ncbi:MAG: gfo/Idh/MocA family oxidoreductase [Thermoprotei archaeon]|nr:MAG: gfo/Idh/MocA family oxidoreductase [Thermoprotei archaeon]RLE97715.1 MAG: gfo/Idh/MocA family oxidoreductase [Thermoprotei archaeon]
MRKYRFAILSFAHIHAWSYARVLKELPNTELVAIYDDSPERLIKAGDAFKIDVDKRYSDYFKLLEKEDIDAVIVASENAKHRDLVIAAAEHGKHVICEKPIATTLKDADEMVQAAKKHRVKFQTAFVMRYHEATVEVKKLLERGEIGDILVITTTNHGMYPGLWFADPKLAGGGAVMDHTVHTADLMRWYTEDEVNTVYARIGVNIRPHLPTEDNALILLRFRKGVLGSIDCSWSRPDNWPIWGDVYLGIIGTEGYILVDAFRSCITLASENKTLKWIYHGPDCDKEMIRDFVKCIEEDREPRASGWDGRQALEIALAAYESHKRGEVIELPLA